MRNVYIYIPIFIVLINERNKVTKIYKLCRKYIYIYLFIYRTRTTLLIYKEFYIVI